MLLLLDCGQVVEVYPQPGDEELWRLARTDPAAFGTLFERHARSVFAFCVWRSRDRGLAEDLTSTVFLEAWRRRASVELSGSSALPYLLGVANNVTRNTNRSIRRYRRVLRRLQPESDVHSDEEDAVARTDSARSFDDACRALEVLTEPERDVFVLVAWSGLSYDAAAVALGIPIGTVRSRLSRGRHKLQAALVPPPDVIAHSSSSSPTPSTGEDSQ